MITLFWRFWTVTLFIGMLFTHAGQIEGAAYPVLHNITPVTNSVARSADKLCWSWEADKVRPATIDDLDAVLDRPAVDDRNFPEVYDQTTGMGWHKKGGHPAMHIRHNDCIQLPKDTKLSEPLHLTQTILYNSAIGPWRVPVSLPTVEDPGMAPNQDHATAP